MIDTSLDFPIPPPAEDTMEAARRRQARLTKPQGALGQLEELAVHLAGIQRSVRPHIVRPVVVIAAADHGVAAEAVSAYPQPVTAQMVANFLQGGAAINVLAQAAGAHLVIVDAGVASDLPSHPALCVLKVARGTQNLLHRPAMTREQARLLVARGAALAMDLAKEGCDLLALGEMGIGNTTSAALITAALTGADGAGVTGCGTGLNDEQLAHKQAIVAAALKRHKLHGMDGWEVLARVGGFEIAFLAGCCLGAAAQAIPILLDGYITGAAALVARAIRPEVGPYLIAAHRSVEPGHRLVLDNLGLRPLLDLDLRLGEGSGAALAIPLVRAAADLLNNMATFAEAQVDEAL